jgi:hypothetical protein
MFFYFPLQLLFSDIGFVGVAGGVVGANGLIRSWAVSLM